MKVYLAIDSPFFIKLRNVLKNEDGTTWSLVRDLISVVRKAVGKRELLGLLMLILVKIFNDHNINPSGPLFRVRKFKKICILR